MWDHTDGQENHHCCAYVINLIPCLSLDFIIIIDREVVAPGNGKDLVDVMNSR